MNIHTTADLHLAAQHRSDQVSQFTPKTKNTHTHRPNYYIHIINDVIKCRVHASFCEDGDCAQYGSRAQSTRAPCDVSVSKGVLVAQNDQPHKTHFENILHIFHVG